MSARSWPRLAGWTLALPLLAVAFYLGGRLRQHALDDAYIVYRYAHNLAAGDGFVYNPGERVLATTSPLFALVLGALGRLGADIPTAGYWLGVLALGVTAHNLFRIGARTGKPLAGAIAAVLVATSPDLLLTLGLESTLYLALATAAVWAAVAGRLAPAGVLLGLATLTRGDAVLLGLVLLATALARRRRLPIAALAGWALVILPWSAFALGYFGSPLPSTLFSKVLQGQSGFFQQHFLTALPTVWNEWHVGITPLYWLLVPAWALGLFQAVRQQRAWLVWPAWAGLYIVAYALLNVPYYYWYYAPLVPPAAMIAALGIAHLAEMGAGALGARRATARLLLVGALTLPLLVAQAQFAHRVEGLQPYPFAVAYTGLGRWLARETPPEATIGTLEVGLLGYYSGRRMVDFAGLVQPEVARHIARDDFAWALDAYRPDYVVWSPQRDGWFTRSDAFQRHYEEVYRFPNGYLDPLVVSRRRDD